MDKKISVIVPIYNVEKYLDKCVQSIINQTYTNLEIILVDDGSPDKCGEMIDRYSEIDSRIKVIHKANGGLSDARNAGLEIATGDFIAFVDSDDWIDIRMYEILLKTLLENNADIVECEAKYVFDDIEYKKDIDDMTLSVYSNEDALYNLIIESNLKQTVWNKLYKKNIINGIKFEFGKMHEDEFWTYQVFSKSTKIIKINQELYYYLQRAESIMNSKYSLNRVDALEGRKRRLEYIKKQFPGLIDIARENFLFSCLYQYQYALINGDSKDKYIVEKIVKDYISTEKNSIKNLSYKLKIWIYFANLNIKVCCKIRNILKIGV